MNRAVVVAVVFWLCFGTRLVLDKTVCRPAAPEELRIPLSELPVDVLGPSYRCLDVPLSPRVLAISCVDSYLQRFFFGDDLRFWFYVGYIAGWNPSGIHHAEECFPLVGLVQDRKEVIEVSMPETGKKPRFNEIQWSDQQGNLQYSLSTFFFNGEFEPSEWRLRTRRVMGIRYFAIIEICGPFVESPGQTREYYSGILRKVIPLLLRHFPD